MHDLAVIRGKSRPLATPRLKLLPNLYRMPDKLSASNFAPRPRGPYTSTLQKRSSVFVYEHEDTMHQLVVRQSPANPPGPRFMSILLHGIRKKRLNPTGTCPKNDASRYKSNTPSDWNGPSNF